MKSFLYIHNWNFSSPTHLFHHFILNAALWRDQPNSGWVWDAIVGYIRNTCIINMMPCFCCPVFVVLQTLRLTVLNLTLSGLMVWKKIIVLIQQSCACVLCQMLVCPLTQSPASFLFASYRANISWTWEYVLKLKWAGSWLFISFF